MNAMMTASASVGQILGDAGMTVLIGVVVVFAVLILLTAIFKAFGMTFELLGKRKSTPKAEKPTPPAAPKAAPVAPVAPVVDDGISEEVVAAIMAAVSCMAPQGTTYRVRSIGRVKGERSAWAAAGVAEATRPF